MQTCGEDISSAEASSSSLSSSTGVLLPRLSSRKRKRREGEDAPGIGGTILFAILGSSGSGGSPDGPTEGTVVSIGDSSSVCFRKKTFTCIDCARRMHARRGEQRAHHFAHNKSPGAEHGFPGGDCVPKRNVILEDLRAGFMNAMVHLFTALPPEELRSVLKAVRVRRYLPPCRRHVFNPPPFFPVTIYDLLFGRGGDEGEGVEEDATTTTFRVTTGVDIKTTTATATTTVTHRLIGDLVFHKENAAAAADSPPALVMCVPIGNNRASTMATRDALRCINVHLRQYRHFHKDCEGHARIQRKIIEMYTPRGGGGDDACTSPPELWCREPDDEEMAVIRALCKAEVLGEEEEESAATASAASDIPAEKAVAGRYRCSMCSDGFLERHEVDTVIQCERSEHPEGSKATQVILRCGECEVVYLSLAPRVCPVPAKPNKRKRESSVSRLPVSPPPARLQVLVAKEISPEEEEREEIAALALSLPSPSFFHSIRRTRASRAREALLRRHAPPWKPDLGIPANIISTLRDMHAYCVRNGLSTDMLQRVARRFHLAAEYR